MTAIAGACPESERLGWAREDPPEVRLAKLEQFLARHDLAGADPVLLLASLLSLPIPDRVPLTI